MTKEQQINFIREKCIDVNPGTKLDVWQSYYDHWTRLKTGRVGLADVLLAIDKANVYVHVRASGEFHDGENRGKCFWNLRADDLREQSDETMTFIANLLK